YLNELWGGVEDGYRVVSETNYDWGQGLRELACWQQRQGLATLDVWYFGSDPLLRRLPMRGVPPPVLPLRAAADVPALVRGRYLAVGTTVLYGNLSSPGLRRAVEFLRPLRPVDRTTTFLIFDLTAAAGP